MPFGLLVAASPTMEAVAIELCDGGPVTGNLVDDAPDAVRRVRGTIERDRWDGERRL